MADHNEAMRLAESIKARAVGWTEWRVEDPASGSYVIAFNHRKSVSPERDALDWLADHKARHPESQFANHVVAKHRCYSQVEQDALTGADLLVKQAERIAELESAHAIAIEIGAQYAAERDQLREEVERLLSAVHTFCDATSWSAQSWKDQPYIKPLFDIDASQKEAP